MKTTEIPKSIILWSGISKQVSCYRIQRSTEVNDATRLRSYLLTSPRELHAFTRQNKRVHFWTHLFFQQVISPFRQQVALVLSGVAADEVPGSLPHPLKGYLRTIGGRKGRVREPSPPTRRGGKQSEMCVGVATESGSTRSNSSAIWVKGYNSNTTCSRGDNGGRFK